jgi:hypothetical protein
VNPVRWTTHALTNLDEREVSREEVERIIAAPEHEVPGRPGRTIRMGLYYDKLLSQTMLLRIVVEHSVNELVVVTVYKTSQIQKYFKRTEP